MTSHDATRPIRPRVAPRSDRLDQQDLSRHTTCRRRRGEEGYGEPTMEPIIIVLIILVVLVFIALIKTI
ncbi:hypothetical protein, partial [Streptomyces sp. NPDC054826]